MITSYNTIVFSFIKYRESSIIAKLFSKEYGLESYIIKGVIKKKANRLIFFQPLTLLNIEAYRKPNSTLISVYNFSLSTPLHSINSEMTKSSMALFISETINEILKNGVIDDSLFDLLDTAIRKLEESSSASISNVLIEFMHELIQLIGFAGSSYKEATNYSAKVDKMILHLERNLEDFQKPRSLEIIRSILR